MPDVLWEEDYLLDLTKPYHNLLGVVKNGTNQTFYYDNNVTAMEENGHFHYYLQDELGSPLRVSNWDNPEDGAAGKPNYLTYGYDEFGNDLGKELEQEGIPNPYSSQGEDQPFGYTGYRYDDISSTYFAQAREYQPKTGRFTAEDIIKGNGLIPETLNPYVYCWNNPLGLVDLDGKAPELGNYYVYYLNNADGAKGLGHNSILIVDDKGTSELYSFMGTGPMLEAIKGENSLGYMGYEKLDKSETDTFLETGSISITIPGGNENIDNYDRALMRQITKEEYNQVKSLAERHIELYDEVNNLSDDNVRKMYIDNVIGVKYNMYTYNCDTVAGEILGKIDPYFISCQNNLILASLLTPNNSYAVRESVLSDTWENIQIGKNNLLEWILTGEGLYYTLYAEYEKKCGQECELD